MPLTLSSAVFEDHGMIPREYTCDGENKNPPFSFGNIPPGTKSFVFIMDDPDAPGDTWDHWVIFNMPSTTPGLKTGKEIPPGVQGSNTSGTMEYEGPCPPAGEHRYVCMLYALDTFLELPPGATKQAILRAMEGHVIESAELTGRYARAAPPP